MAQTLNFRHAPLASYVIEVERADAQMKKNSHIITLRCVLRVRVEQRRGGRTSYCSA